MSGYAEWSPATAYAVNDIVYWQGVVYVCVQININRQPPNVTYWAAQGGAAGVSSLQGLQGTVTLSSPDSSVGIAVAGQDIQLTAAAAPAGVSSINSETGAITVSSPDYTVKILSPTASTITLQTNPLLESKLIPVPATDLNIPSNYSYYFIQSAPVSLAWIDVSSSTYVLGELLISAGSFTSPSTTADIYFYLSDTSGGDINYLQTTSPYVVTVSSSPQPIAMTTAAQMVFAANVPFTRVYLNAKKVGGTSAFQLQNPTTLWRVTSWPGPYGYPTISLANTNLSINDGNSALPVDQNSLPAFQGSQITAPAAVVGWNVYASINWTGVITGTSAPPYSDQTCWAVSQPPGAPTLITGTTEAHSSPSGSSSLTFFISNSPPYTGNIYLAFNIANNVTSATNAYATYTIGAYSVVVTPVSP